MDEKFKDILTRVAIIIAVYAAWRWLHGGGFYFL
jgi:hypothetical protein